MSHVTSQEVVLVGETYLCLPIAERLAQEFGWDRYPVNYLNLSNITGQVRMIVIVRRGEHSVLHTTLDWDSARNCFILWVYTFPQQPSEWEAMTTTVAAICRKTLTPPDTDPDTSDTAKN